MQIPLPFTLRKADAEDIGAMESLIAHSARGLSVGHYTNEQIEAALGSALGVDTQLVRDRTYFVVEAEGELVGCGGWSRRKTLFGSDGRSGREPELLNPATDAARIRAFFVRPDWARRGIGRALLEKCETEAASEGFTSLALMSTLPGHALYKAFGFTGDERVEYELPGNVKIHFIPMTNWLGNR